MIGLYNKDDRKNPKTLCIADFTIRMTEKSPVPCFYIGNISNNRTFSYIETVKNSYFLSSLLYKPFRRRKQL